MQESESKVVTRLNMEQVHRIHREKDGLEDGAVLFHVEGSGYDYDLLHGYEDLDLLDLPLDPPEDLDEKGNDTFVATWFYLQRTSKTLQAVGLLDGGCTDPDDPRCSYLSGVLDDFLAAYELERDNLKVESFSAVGNMMDFMDYYTDRVLAEIDPQEALKTVNDARAELLEVLNTPASTRLLTAAVVDKITPIIRDVPILILSPLESLERNNTNEGKEYLGVYHPGKHYITIDPVAIKKTASGSTESVTAAVVFHELVHAASSHWHNRVDYTEDDGDGYVDKTTRVDINTIWPPYFLEGMTEKLTWRLFSQSEKYTDKSSRKLSPVFSETVWRENVSTNPKEVLGTGKSAALHLKQLAGYRQERLLIDALFDKLDWKAAGLTLQQAEVLAARAFFDLPDNTSRQTENCKYLRAFNTALNKAGHQGILQRVGTIVGITNVHQAIDMLEHPNFDPHERNSIPSVASPYVLSRIEDYARRNPHTLGGRHARLIDLGAPEHIIKASIEHAIKQRERMVASKEAWHIIRQGVSASIALQYGARSRRLKFKPEERMLAAIFGDEVPVRPTETLYFDDADERTPAARADAARLVMWLANEKQPLLNMMRQDDR